jgi:hypothetical protein
MAVILAASTLSSAFAFAALAGWIAPGWTGTESVATWLAISASTAFMSASAMDG